MNKEELFELLKENMTLETEFEGYNNPWSNATQRLIIRLKYDDRIITQTEELI